MLPSCARDSRRTRLGPTTGIGASTGSLFTLLYSSAWNALVFPTQSDTGSRSGSLGAAIASTAPRRGPLMDASAACIWALPPRRSPTPSDDLMPSAARRLIMSTW